MDGYASGSGTTQEAQKTNWREAQAVGRRWTFIVGYEEFARMGICSGASCIRSCFTQLLVACLTRSAQPLSAAYAKREPPPPLAEQDPLLPPEPVPQPSRLTSLLPWAKSPTIPLPLPSPPPDYDSTPGSLQVGVAIIMPLQLDGSDRRPDGAARVPLFELGFVEFPWSDEKQDLCLPLPTTPDLQDQEGGPSTETT